MPNRKTESLEVEQSSRSSSQKSGQTRKPNVSNISSSEQSPNYNRDQDAMSNETLSDVNQLNAFGGDQPQREMAADDTRESVEDMTEEDSQYNR